MTPSWISATRTPPREPAWPKVDFIVGNPPFLGSRLQAGQLGADYVEALSTVYEDRLGGRPDICCYWFEKARKAIERRRCGRAGLLATQGIRGGTNRNVLKRIKETGEIFFAVSDRDWILDGANVHVSMVGFDDGSEVSRVLDGQPVAAIHSNLTATADVTEARPLPGNRGISFQGGIKRGPFDVPESEALKLLRSGGSPNGRPNSDVLLPYINAADVTGRSRNHWIVDFGREMPQEQAAQYEAPFTLILQRVKPDRQRLDPETGEPAVRQRRAREVWWLHWNWRQGMNSAVGALDRFIVTPRVAKHRVFEWREHPTYSDNTVIVFAGSEDYFLGVLHSRVHEVWARAQGTQLRERESGFRYTPTTCFETFPFPWPPGEEPEDDLRSEVPGTSGGSCRPLQVVTPSASASTAAMTRRYSPRPIRSIGFS